MFSDKEGRQFVRYETLAPVRGSGANGLFGDGREINAPDCAEIGHTHIHRSVINIGYATRTGRFVLRRMAPRGPTDVKHAAYKLLEQLVLAYTYSASRETHGALEKRG